MIPQHVFVRRRSGVREESFLDPFLLLLTRLLLDRSPLPEGVLLLLDLVVVGGQHNLDCLHLGRLHLELHHRLDVQVGELPYRRDVVLDITFIHCVYLTNFHFSRNKRKLLFFTEGISLLGALLKQELDRNRGLLFWGSGQDRAGGLRACRRD